MIEGRLAALGSRRPDTLTADFPRGDSAVLVLVVLSDEPGIVLTKRSAKLRTDPGFVAFPGGRLDPGETPEDAARRECEEEVGVPRESITVHGRLDETWNGAGFRIIPIVASISGPLELEHQPDEVSVASVIPLAAATSADHHEIVVKHIDGFDFHDDVITFNNAGKQWQIYGPTADLTRDLAGWLNGVDRRQGTRRQRELDHFAAHGWG